jgi:transcriptional regulator GlxA family with amidase domain
MRIAVYALDGMTMFHLSVPSVVFDEVRDQGIAEWTTVLFSEEPGTVTTAEGLTLSGLAGPEAAEAADLVVVPSWHEDGRPAGRGLRGILGMPSARRPVVAGLCLGAIPLAEAGLLDGRTAVTHWQAFDLIAERYPRVALDRDVLYIDHGDVLTSAGTASGLDACLHIVRARLGADAANRVARSLVVAPHRDGGQAQYIARPVPEEPADDTVAATLAWAEAHLDRAHRSRRTFVRAFRASTGTSVGAWLRARRLDEARRLLETTDLPIDRVCELCGFGSPVTLRQRFRAAFGTTPSDYRRRFTTR